ncbi:MAG: type II toxin-antitoxin system RelE/ParE family toxin [Gammaproteobacteria bacterium]
MRLLYSETAVSDLVRLREFIVEKDPLAAARVGAELVTRIENLLVFPELGHIVDQAPDPKVMHDVIFGKYIVRYTIHSETIVILRVWHYYEGRGRIV